MEVWKDIKNYEGLYQVSNLGKVKSINNFKILKPWKQNSGYLVIGLHRDTKIQKYLIHRLVAIIFLENTEDKPCVNHINGIKTDNRAENLEWCTYSENMKHSIRTGLSNPGETCQRKVICIETGKVYDSATIAGKLLNIYRGTICNCCSKIKYSKTAGGYHWKYANKL